MTLTSTFVDLQPCWVGKLLEALSAELSHVLVLQHLYTDSSRVMHVAARVEAPLPRPPPRSPLAALLDDDDGWWVPPPSNAIVLPVAPVAPPPNLRPRSQRRNWAELVDAEQQQPPKRRHRGHKQLKKRYWAPTACSHCGTEYRYQGPFEK